MRTKFDFIKRLTLISLPIILQQLFLNLASLLDTMMVGQLDEISISGVYIATQIVFVCNLMIFGSIEGASVFFCQFFGIKDKDHLKNCYALKYLFSGGIGLLLTIIILIFAKPLSSLFLSNPLEIEVAVKYLNFVALSFVPYALSVTISSSLRETHRSLSPMIITLIGVLLNFTFNYLFIFGNFNFPKMGASGAAIGTLIDRVVEMVLLIGYLLFRKIDFSQNFFSSLKIEKRLLKNVIIKSIPLFLNETLWSLAQFILVYLFTKCDGIATTVLPIVQTIFNLIFVVSLGLGNGVSIIVGNTIGEGNYQDSQNQAYQSLVFTLVTGVVLGLGLFLSADLITSIYTGVGEQAKKLAAYFIRFNAIYLIINSINTTLFFLLRAGGKTEIVFFFDSCYGWIISIPFAIILVNCTSLSLKQVYIFVYLMDLLKTVIGMILLLSKKWYKNLTLVVNKGQ